MSHVPQIQLALKEIETIAEDLDCGFRCFYHVEKKEYKALINRDDPNYFVEEDEADEEWNEIDEHWSDYLEFEKMDSGEAFNVMEEFAEEVKDSDFKRRLLKALNNSRPFRNFKYEVDNSDYRQDWFDFKKEKTMEWVKKQVEDYNQSQQLESDSETEDQGN